MYQLSDDDIAFILDDIRRNGVEMEDLQLNLLDHVCCIIENNLEANGDFRNFYSETIKSFYKGKLSELQEETISLLNNKYYYTMKKFMFISGILSASLISIGIILKFMHMAGAAVLLVSGTAIFSLLFLPLLFTMKVKEKQQLKDKVLLTAGSMIAVLISLAILFKVMHWPGANMMGTISLITMIVVYIPLYFFSGIKQQESKSNTIITSILMICGCGLFLALARAPYATRYQSIKDTSSYLRNEKIYEVEKKHAAQLLSSTEKFNSVSNEILNECDQLKGDILEWSSGVRKIGNDFEDKNTFIYDGWVKTYFHDYQKAAALLEKIKSDFKTYNALLPSNKDVHVLPLDAIDFNVSEEKVLWALTDLTQVEMMVLQNLK